MTFRSGLWKETEIPEYFNLFISHMLLNSMKKVKLDVISVDCSLNFQLLNWINNSFINNLYEIY
jgi:hypothetical protein